MGLRIQLLKTPSNQHDLWCGSKRKQYSLSVTWQNFLARMWKQRWIWKWFSKGNPHMDIRSCRMVCGLIYIHSYQTLFALAKNVCVLVAQLCPTFCDPMDCSQPYSSAHGILQARILEWVAIPFSRECSWPRDQTWVSRIAGSSLLSKQNF